MVGGGAVLRDQLLLGFLSFFRCFAHEIRSYASVLLDASRGEYRMQGKRLYAPCSGWNANARLPKALEFWLPET